MRLPEREVARVLLERALLLLLGRVAGRRLVVVSPGKPSVVLEAADAEVDVAAGLVGEVALDQLFDQRDDLGDRLGGLRLVVRSPETERSVSSTYQRAASAASFALAPGAAS